jgi:diaminohydroxyphosphoribosylaminopyrimidine deaminase/5-amino-6-(5-phosphoribosylamino)uracil reductase
MSGITTHDEALLRRALSLAERGLYTTDPNPRVGCIIARGEMIVGEGWHARAGGPHAEVKALKAAGEQARGATAYVTLEPCSHTGRTPPCADALIAAGVARVVCCTTDPNPKVAGQGLEKLRAAGIKVEVGALTAEARGLNCGFFSRFERKRPYARLKMAMSLDGRTAFSGGGPGWISGAASRQDVQHWRARSAAILTGSGTVRIDNPRLNVRLQYGPFVRQPLRVVLDTELTCSKEALIFQGGGNLTFAADDAHGDAQDRLVKRVARVPGGLDLHAILAELAALEINELLLECGATLAGAFIAEDLVDEMVLYVAPRFLGADAAPLANLTGLDPLQFNSRFEYRTAESVGDDLRLVLVRRA